jgi:hypothetical protein
MRVSFCGFVSVIPNTAATFAALRIWIDVAPVLKRNNVDCWTPAALAIELRLTPDLIAPVIAFRSWFSMLSDFFFIIFSPWTN